MRIITLSSILLTVALPVYAADVPQLITNRAEHFTLGVITEKPLAKNVYDLSFVAYDKAFSEEFGLIPDHVSEMDKGLRFMEIKMITEGTETNCYYNVVLDKNIALNFPQEDFSLSRHPRMNFPWLYQKDGVNLQTIKRRPDLTGINPTKNLPFNPTIIYRTIF